MVPSTPTSAVFVNSVWFLNLVLSLTCGLMSTLLQQWATQRNHLLHVRAHIREYFARGADELRISALVEALPALLLISVLLFFSGLVVFAFLGSDTVAFITVAVVAFCTLWYLMLTLAQNLQINKKKSFSHSVISILEGSAKRVYIGQPSVGRSKFLTRIAN